MNQSPCFPRLKAESAFAYVFPQLTSVTARVSEAGSSGQAVEDLMRLQRHGGGGEIQIHRPASKHRAGYSGMKIKGEEDSTQPEHMRAEMCTRGDQNIQ